MVQEVLDPAQIELKEVAVPIEYSGFLIDLNSAKEGKNTTIYKVINRDTLNPPLEPASNNESIDEPTLDAEQEEEYRIILDDLKSQIPNITPERIARERHLFEESFGSVGNNHPGREYDLAVTALELLNDPDGAPDIIIDEFDKHYGKLLEAFPEQLYLDATDDKNIFIVHFRPFEELQPAKFNLEYM